MTIVAAFSPDPYGQAAADHAAAEARASGDRLVLVNLTTGNSLVDKRYASDDAVATLEKRLRADGVDVVVRHEMVSDVADAILEVAASEGARLIVVGVRKRTPVGKMLMGSVAQRVILEADCPVLSVKPPAAG